MKHVILLLSSLLLSGTMHAQDCSKVKKSVDKFTDEVMWMSPVMETISFMGTTGKLAITLTTESSKILTGKELIILLENGTKIKTDDVESIVDYKREQYLYRTVLFLDAGQIKELSEHLITDFRFSFVDKSVPKNKAEEYRGYLNCIVNAK